MSRWGAEIWVGGGRAGGVGVGVREVAADRGRQYPVVW